MANYDSIQAIIDAGVTNAIQLRNNSKQDDGTDTITAPSWLQYKGAAVSNVYASGNSWIGFGSTTEHLKVNRRDAALYNLWTEEGTLYGYYNFFRIRWQGPSAYKMWSYDSYKLTYDLVVFDTGDLWLHIVDIPTSNYDGSCSLAAETTVAYTRPTTENPDVTFKREDGAYVITYAVPDIATPFDKRYLVRDGDAIYTVADGVLQQLEGALTASMFQTYGVADIPAGSVLMQLASPELLYWQDSDTGLPTFTGTVQGTPAEPQEIISSDINVGHPSIYGITGVECACAGEPALYVSFDGGAWMGYTDGNWIASDTGMTPEELTAIPEGAWSFAIAEVQNMRIRAVMDADDSITSIKISFNNASPTQAAAVSEEGADE